MKERLDQLLCDRGLAESRQRAQSLILAGSVRVDGQRVDKPGTRIAPDREIVVIGPDHPFVGRGGVKLAHALDCFGVDPAGKTCIDIGASTGGFTDCLLQRGAARVIAIDVGRGQLHWRLRNDPRIQVTEGCNARALDRDMVPDPIDIATIDVSFISLRLILPPLLTLDLRGPVLALVKPQFEVGRREVGRGGVVRDPTLQRRTVEAIARFSNELGLAAIGLAESPITGADGNREFFLRLRPGGGAPASLANDLEEVFHAP
jgi:23S rRNA (cytidine1920-2'-O)/16S rRNA (cytidine1409-2'-O)-methyltransferase